MSCDPPIKELHDRFTTASFSAQDTDPLDPQDFGSLDPNPKKYADPHDKILTENCNQKKTCLLSKTDSELLKKERL